MENRAEGRRRSVEAPRGRSVEKEVRVGATCWRNPRGESMARASVSGSSE